MMTRREAMTRAAAVLPVTAVAIPVGAQPIRTLTASEYALDERGNLRLNPDLVGSTVDAVFAGGYLYLSLAGVRIQILRWAGGLSSPEVIHGSWPGQERPWNLRTTPAGRCLAFSEDGCCALLG